MGAGRGRPARPRPGAGDRGAATGSTSSAGLLECVCGRRLRNDGTFADGRHRKLHANPCEAWGRKARLGDETWEEPVLAQVAGIELDDATIAPVVAALGSSRGRSRSTGPGSTARSASSRSTTPPAGSSDEAYLARLHGAPRAQGRDRRAHERRGISAERAVEWLRALRRDAGARPTYPKEKADLLHAIYERIIGRRAGDRVVSGSRRRPTRTDWRWRCPKRLQWRARQDSNLRPSAPEADALSTELQARDTHDR